NPRFVNVAASLFGLAAVLIGAGHLVLATRSQNMPDENERVRRLITGMQPTLASMGAHRPLLVIEEKTWAVGVGLMLQLARAGVPFGVEDNFADRFDPNLSANGEEDALVSLSGPDHHQQLVMRPGNVTLAESDWRSRQLYVDAVSLVDHPEY